MQFLIAYDICDPRRLARVARRLEKRALRLQKSVFWIECSSEQLDDVLDYAAEVMNWQVDCLQAWRVHNGETPEGNSRGVTIPAHSMVTILGNEPPLFVLKGKTRKRHDRQRSKGQEPPAQPTSGD